MDYSIWIGNIKLFFNKGSMYLRCISSSILSRIREVMAQLGSTMVNLILQINTHTHIVQDGELLWKW